MEVNQRLTDHIEADKARYEVINKSIDNLSKTVENIRDKFIHPTCYQG